MAENPRLIRGFSFFVKITRHIIDKKCFSMKGENKDDRYGIRTYDGRYRNGNF